MEAQALRVNYSSESKQREALESHIADLKRGLSLTEIFSIFLQFGFSLLLSCQNVALSDDLHCLLRLEEELS
jgi:hypothetical protein